jgi:hypothetical protein
MWGIGAIIKKKLLFKTGHKILRNRSSESYNEYNPLRPVFSRKISGFITRDHCIGLHTGRMKSAYCSTDFKLNSDF